MNRETGITLLVLVIAAIGVIVLLFILIPVPATAAPTVCLSKREARHLWPKQHIYWYSKDHCWSNRRGGPPRGIKIDPIIPNHARAEVKENTVTEKRLPAPKTEAPLQSNKPLNIVKDGCCWPQLTEFELLWDKIMQALKGKTND